MLSDAAGEIRQAESALNRIISELDQAGVWSGADADRFQRDWSDNVRAKLLGAANSLDAASVIPLI